MDGFGNVFFAQQVTSEEGLAESEITKLNAWDGTPRWKFCCHDGSELNNGPLGLVIGEDRDVYLASNNGQDTIIVKLVESGQDWTLEQARS